MIVGRFIVAVLLWIWAGGAMAVPLMLFGVPLQGATRATLTPALQKAGLPLIPNGPQQWFDTYRLNGQLPQLQGASMFSVKYTKHNRFAVAEYKFPSFNDTRQVQNIITMVEYKYGQPSSIVGDVEHGPVTARWKESGDMEIKVWRGWPVTTTYMDLENITNVARMLSETRAGRLLPARTDVNEQKEWQPPSLVEQATPSSNKTFPLLWEWGVIAFFCIPALAMVIFGHFIARVTRIPPNFKVAAHILFTRIGQFVRRPQWFLRGDKNR